jgi:hypothetical protein
MISAENMIAPGVNSKNIVEPILGRHGADNVLDVIGTRRQPEGAG